MTKRKAFDILEHNWTRLVNPDYSDNELNEALVIAMKALEREITIVSSDCLPESAIKETEARMDWWKKQQLKGGSHENT